MRFELKHELPHPLEVVERGLLDPELLVRLVAEMKSVQEVEVLELREEGGLVHRRVRYVPTPFVKKVGLKEVNPSWMEWVEESSYDRSRHCLEFQNLPRLTKVAALLRNTGRVRLLESGPTKTLRVVEGELKVRVPLLGRLAERIIYQQARRILDEEAAVLARLLSFS